MALALTHFATLLLLLLVLATHAWAPVVTPSNPIGTPWTKDVTPTQSALYPRPQLVRPPWSWQSLNGLWQIDYEVGHLRYYITLSFTAYTRQYGLYVRLSRSSHTLTNIHTLHSNQAGENDAPPVGKTLPHEILVPYPLESSLSGIRTVAPNNTMFYRRVFMNGSLLPACTGRRVLHVERSDWNTTVFANGKEICNHVGGYDPFTCSLPARAAFFDLELIVRVYDATEQNPNHWQLYGKQQRAAFTDGPSGFMYTSTSGIWDTIWAECLPAKAAIRDLHVKPDVDGNAVFIDADIDSGTGTGSGSDDSGASTSILQVTIQDATGATVATATSAAGATSIKVPMPPKPHLWSPPSPYLYNATVQLLPAKQGGANGNVDAALDVVVAYFGMRKIHVSAPTTAGATHGDAAKYARIQLNNKPFYQIGTLDQGWFPDGTSFLCSFTSRIHLLRFNPRLLPLYSLSFAHSLYSITFSLFTFSSTNSYPSFTL